MLRTVPLQDPLVNVAKFAGICWVIFANILDESTGSGSGSGMFYIRLRPSTAIGCGTKQ
jgi:hypothetical protein